jgi:hypothetical protein
MIIVVEQMGHNNFLALYLSCLYVLCLLVTWGKIRILASPYCTVIYCMSATKLPVRSKFWTLNFQSPCLLSPFGPTHN